jgi:hypothetical protein
LDRKDRKIKDLQKKISALKRSDENDDGSDDDDADANASPGAGNAFGGREEKKQAKKKTKKWQLWLAYWYAIILLWRVRRAYRKEPKKWRITSRVVSYIRRRVSGANVLHNAIPREPVYSNPEMDTHADTCVLGPNFIILHYTGRECDVSP